MREPSLVDRAMVRFSRVTANRRPSAIAGALEVTREDHASLFEEVIWPSLYARCEAFGGLKVTGSWAGFYEYNTLDQNAVVGFHPQVSNLLLCTPEVAAVSDSEA